MDWVQSLIVKFLEKIISVSIIRDIEESYLVSKNPMPLGVGVSGTNVPCTVIRKEDVYE